MISLESNMQIACVNWFRMQYHELWLYLFAVPNGGSRNKLEAVRMKREGIVSGVSDLILLIPNRGYMALCIEMKTEKGRQSPEQKKWQQAVEAQGYRYVVCRSIEDFMNEINWYLA